jgi:hypothetical protein
MKKTLAIITVILGVILFFSSLYIREQVDEGEKQVVDAQHKLNKGGGILSISPLTSAIGKTTKRAFQKKIVEGEKEIDFYDHVANWAEISGIILIVLGAGIFYVYRKNKR